MSVPAADRAEVTAIILAGGRGTRLAGLHPDLPKPLVPVLGRPFLDWLTAWLAGFGIRRFVYATGHLSARIEAWAEDASFPGLDRQCRREAAPLGTGGALLNCLDLVGEWVLVTNGDGLIDTDLHALLAVRHQAGIDGGMIGVSVEDAGRYGSLTLSGEGLLRGFAEKQPGRGVVNAGIYLFRRDVLAAHGRPGAVSLEHSLFPDMIAAGRRIRVVTAETAAFIDIGTPESLAVADAFVSANFAALSKQFGGRDPAKGGGSGEGQHMTGSMDGCPIGRNGADRRKGRT